MYIYSEERKEEGYGARRSIIQENEEHSNLFSVTKLFPSSLWKRINFLNSSFLLSFFSSFSVYFARLKGSMYVTYLLYFGYMGVISLGFFLITGETIFSLGRYISTAVVVSVAMFLDFS